MKRLDLTNSRFGKLTVISKAESMQNKTRWSCICDCGNKAIIRTAELRRGDTKSCGCLQKDSPPRLSHGHNRNGMRTRTYRIWTGMIARCKYPNRKEYRWYGGKGIKVCDRWMKFENFLNDMGEIPKGMTIDRINSDGNYEPKNCQLLSQSDNSRKK